MRSGSSFCSLSKKYKFVNEDYFEIEARNQKEAALIVAKFVIENEIIEIDTTIPIEFEVEEIEEEKEEDFEDRKSVV